MLSKMDLEQIRDSTEYFDDYTSAQTQALGETGVDLQNLINHMLSATRRIIAGDASGVGDWKDTAAASLSELSDASGYLNDQVTQINSFLCRAPGQSFPVYNSTNIITQSGCVEQAISELDAAVFSAGGSGTWQEHFDNGNGALNIDGTPDGEISFTADGKWTFNFSTPGFDTVFSSSGVQIRALGFRTYDQLTGQVSAGSTNTVPESRSYTPDVQGRNLKVYRNGQFLLPGSGVTSGDENFNDYREVSSTSVINNEKWKTDDVIQYVISG